MAREKKTAAAAAYQMARIAATIAPSSRAGARQSQGGAIGLDVAKALAVVTLLGVCSSGLRANIGFMTWTCPGQMSAHLSVSVCRVGYAHLVACL